MMGTTRARSSTVAAGVIVALAALSGCGGGSNDAKTMDASNDSGGSLAAPEPADAPQVAGRAADPVGAARAEVQTKAVIRNARIAITGKDLDEIRAEVDRLLAAVDGTVDSDRTSTDKKGRTDSATMVLRVPVASFDATKSAVEKLGTLKSSDETGEDVTTKVIDVDERVQTLSNSLDRLQKFQREATDVADLLRYEDQITARQSELQSLKAQQSYLHDQTAMSTIALSMSTPATYVAPPDALENAGFLAGLESGWHAFVDVVVVCLTVVGAVIPFLLAGLVIGLPTWLGLRALLRRRRAPETQPDPVA